MVILREKIKNRQIGGSKNFARENGDFPRENPKLIFAREKDDFPRESKKC